MTKNQVLQGIVEKLTADIPAVTWTRRALFAHEWMASGAGTTGCVVVEKWTGAGDQGADRLWSGDIKVLVHAKHQGNANVDMVVLLDEVESSLSEADLPGVERCQLLVADINQDDLNAGYCSLLVSLSITLL